MVVWIQLAASIGFRGGADPLSLRDFGSLWASGSAANLGQNPYAAHSLTFQVTTPAGTWSAVNLNPPISVLLFQAMAHLDPKLLFRTLQVMSALGYVAIAFILVRTTPTQDAPLRILLLVLWHPFWSTLELGQVYVTLVPLVAVGIVARDRHPWLAGQCIGLLVALKPPFILWPLCLLASGYYRLSTFAMLTAAVFTAIPGALGQLSWYGSWMEASRSAADLRLVVDNLSGVSLLSRWGAPLWLAVAMDAGIGLALLVLLRRRRLGYADASAVGLIAALWVSPVTWVGYYVLLAPVLFTRARWSESMLIGALILAIPGPLLWWIMPSASVVYVVAAGLFLLSVFQHEPSPAAVSVRAGEPSIASGVTDSRRLPW